MQNGMQGCDGGDPGAPYARTVWLFGIEPGNSLSDQRQAATCIAVQDANYSVDTQLQWPFNRNAFKLLAALHGESAHHFREFARERQLFVSGQKGFFKGNIFPYACHRVSAWDDSAARESGCASKEDYRQQCREKHFPVVRGWVESFRPKLILAVGTSYKDDFALAFMGKQMDMGQHTFQINSYTKHLYHCSDAITRLVVIPHLSGGRNGLNSYAAINAAAEFIRELRQDW